MNQLIKIKFPEFLKKNSAPKGDYNIKERESQHENQRTKKCSTAKQVNCGLTNFMHLEIVRG